MATLSFLYDKGTEDYVNHIWLMGKGTDAVGQTWSVDISGIPTGAKINSAKLTFIQGHIYSPPGFAAIYFGTARDDANTIWLEYGGNGYDNQEPTEVDISSYITGNGSYDLYFYRTAHSGGNQSNVYFDSPTIIIDYSDPTTACGAPETCEVAADVTHDSTMLYWSGATDGVNNPIYDYEIQYCESVDGVSWNDWMGLMTASDFFATVSPPATYGNYYKFRVRARGTAGEAFHSDWTESSNTLRRNHEPFPPFTDPVLEAMSTYVKAVHMTELQSRVNVLRTFHGLSEYQFSNIVAGTTSLGGWTGHVWELRNAIDEIGRFHEKWMTISMREFEVATDEELLGELGDFLELYDQNCPIAGVIQQLRNVVMEM